MSLFAHAGTLVIRMYTGASPQSCRPFPEIALDVFQIGMMSVALQKLSTETSRAVTVTGQIHVFQTGLTSMVLRKLSTKTSQAVTVTSQIKVFESGVTSMVG